MDVLRDDGVVIYLNGQELRRDNMGTGPISAFDPAAVQNPTVLEGLYHHSSVDGSLLLQGTNLLAVEVHQHGKDSSDMNFDLHLEASESALNTSVAALRDAEQARVSLERLRALLPAPLRRQRWPILKFALIQEVGDDPNLASMDACFLRFSLQTLLGNRWEARATVNALLERHSAGHLVPAIFEWLWLQDKFLAQSGTGNDLTEFRALTAAFRTTRPPGTSPRQIDLTKHYTGNFFVNLGREFTTLPGTFEPVGGIDFDLRGLVILNSGVYPALPFHPYQNETRSSSYGSKDANDVKGTAWPYEVTGIAIEQKARLLHFLQTSDHPYLRNGIAIARYVIHYSDGSQEEAPVVVGQDIHSIQVFPDTTPKSVVWRGPGVVVKQAQVYRQVWENPFPEKMISHIDFISARTNAVPILLGITLE